MKKQNLADKIKELRKNKGLSQDQLSELSNISVRTIQRIEKGSTIPNGDTLNKLATVLEATIDGLITNDEKEDKGYLTLLSLSSISYILHPFLGLLIPIVLWYLKKNKILKVDEVGRKLISFQITWQLVFFGYFAYLNNGAMPYNMDVSEWTNLLSSMRKPYKQVISILYFYNLFIVLVNIILIQNKLKPRYYPSIPFIWSKIKK